MGIGVCFIIVFRLSFLVLWIISDVFFCGNFVSWVMVVLKKLMLLVYNLCVISEGVNWWFLCRCLMKEMMLVILCVFLIRLMVVFLCVFCVIILVWVMFSFFFLRRKFLSWLEIIVINFLVILRGIFFCMVSFCCIFLLLGYRMRMLL